MRYKRTMADTPNVLRVGGVPQRPMVHLDLVGFRGVDELLGAPEGVHKNIDGALSGDLSVAVEHGDAEHDAQPLRILPGGLVRLERCALPVQLRAPVQVRRRRFRAGRVRRLPRPPRKHVVRADVDEQHAAGRALRRQRRGRRHVQSARPLRVRVALVGEPVGGR